MGFWDKHIPVKTKSEIIAENGFLNLVLIGNGSFLSPQRGSKFLVRKEWKTYTAEFMNEEIVIVVVDKVTDLTQLENFLQNHQIMLTEKEWMLLKKK